MNLLRKCLSGTWARNKNKCSEWHGVLVVCFCLFVCFNFSSNLAYGFVISSLMHLLHCKEWSSCWTTSLSMAKLICTFHTIFKVNVVMILKDKESHITLICPGQIIYQGCTCFKMTDNLPSLHWAEAAVLPQSFLLNASEGCKLQ